jgi:hypothetical protein
VLQVLTVPKTICSMVCSSALVAVAGTTRHRQISGLIPATTTRSRYTADNSPTARTDSGIKVTRNLGDESKPTVKFWAMPEVSLVAAWASTAAVLLLGVGVSRS